MTDKILVKFRMYCGRMGDLHGLFITTQDELDDLIGKEAYFGVVLGKYSEIFGTLEDSMFEVISNDQAKVTWLEQLLGTSVSGFDPRDYVEPSEDEDCVCDPLEDEACICEGVEEDEDEFLDEPEDSLDPYDD